MAAPKRTYFKSSQEKFLVWLPILAFIFVLLEVLNVFNFGIGAEDAKYRFILNVLLLNSIHLICPFLILAFWPSGRAYVKRKLANRNFMLGSFAALCLLFGFSVLLVTSTTEKNSSSVSHQFLISLALWIWAMVPLIHSLRQSSGISILMSKSADRELASERKVTFQTFVKKERRLMNAFCLAMSITLGIYFTGWDGKQTAAILSAIVTFILAALISYNIYKEEEFKNTNKLLFSLKFLMWPFLPFSLIALTTITFCHALEYFALMQKSAGTDELPLKKILTALGLFTLLILYFEVRRFFVLPGTYYATSQPFFFIFLVFYPLLALTHYATDSVIYRFKDADVRESFGSFLTNFEKR